jgi:hypothetical protein
MPFWATNTPPPNRRFTRTGGGVFYAGMSTKPPIPPSVEDDEPPTPPPSPPEAPDSPEWDTGILLPGTGLWVKGPNSKYELGLGHNNPVNDWTLWNQFDLSDVTAYVADIDVIAKPPVINLPTNVGPLTVVIGINNNRGVWGRPYFMCWGALNLFITESLAQVLDADETAAQTIWTPRVLGMYGAGNSSQTPFVGKVPLDGIKILYATGNYVDIAAHGGAVTIFCKADNAAGGSLYGVGASFHLGVPTPAGTYAHYMNWQKVGFNSTLEGYANVGYLNNRYGAAKTVDGNWILYGGGSGYTGGAQAMVGAANYTDVYSNLSNTASVIDNNSFKGKKYDGTASGDIPDTSIPSAVTLIGAGGTSTDYSIGYTTDSGIGYRWENGGSAGLTLNCYYKGIGVKNGKIVSVSLNKSTSSIETTDLTDIPPNVTPYKAIATQGNYFLLGKYGA